MIQLEPIFRLLAYGTGAFTLVFAIATVYAAKRFEELGELPLSDDETSFAPPITILKPIKGAERGLEENLESFLSQAYPAFQIIFCLQDPEDAALEVVERLRRRHAGTDIEIVISKNRIGYNPKINNLSNAYPFIKHDLLMISDSDIRVGSDFLRRVVRPLIDPAVGLVTCLYRSDSGASSGALIEALSINAQFLPNTLVAGFLLRLRFALGAVMLMRRQAFDESGGFANLSEHLADDYLLGHSIMACGYRLEFSNAIVQSTPGFYAPNEAVAHLVRWARTIRVCQPAGYLGLLLLQGIPFLTLYMFAYGVDRFTLAFWISIAIARIFSVGRIHGRYLKRSEMLSQLPWIPISDLLQFGIWILGFRSGAVLWRGERYDIAMSGRLVPRKHPSRSTAATTIS